MRLPLGSILGEVVTLLEAVRSRALRMIWDACWSSSCGVSEDVLRSASLGEDVTARSRRGPGLPFPSSGEGESTDPHWFWSGEGGVGFVRIPRNRRRLRSDIRVMAATVMVAKAQGKEVPTTIEAASSEPRERELDERKQIQNPTNLVLIRT